MCGFLLAFPTSRKRIDKLVSLEVTGAQLCSSRQVESQLDASATQAGSSGRSCNLLNGSNGKSIGNSTEACVYYVNGKVWVLGKDTYHCQC
jgi:hypothetical protein